jgi:prepilin-type N-terminal cleavage/methylation domain-containing protein
MGDLGWVSRVACRVSRVVWFVVPPSGGRHALTGTLRTSSLVTRHSSLVTRRGFTLLELIVSIAILSFGLIGILQALSAALVASRLAEDYSTAAMLAEQKIAELSVQAEDLEPGEDSGDFGELFPRFAWDYRVLDTGVEGLLHATVVVSWRTGQRERSFTAETCLAQGLSGDEAAQQGGMGSP